MSISKQNLAKALFAILTVVAAAGVYCELESVQEVAEAPARTAVSAPAKDALAMGGPASAEPVAGDRGDRSAFTAPSGAPTRDVVDRTSSGAGRGASRKRSERPDEEIADTIPAEDPVAKAAGALAARLEAEPFDARWSADAETLLADHFAAVAGGATLAQARCRSTVCRIELEFASEAARDDGLGSLSLPWDAVGVFQVDERDPRNLVIYATRQPEDLAPRS